MMQGIKDILDALKQLQSTIYLACDEKPADDISKIVRDAVTEITSLRAELEKAKKDGKPVTEKYSLSDAIQLCEDLLNPNMFGYSVTAEVRNRAREALGLKGRE